MVLGGIWFLRGINNIQAPPVMPSSLETTATVLSEPMILPDFKLTDTKGNQFTKQNLKKLWSFLFFGYTYCPDICPTTLSILTETESLLSKENFESKRQYVFVSVDPGRDNIEHLNEYVTYFNPQFLGATGQESEIQTLIKPLGIRYQRSKEKRPEGQYLIDHSAAILLIDPDGNLRALITPPHDANNIANDFMKIVSSIQK